MSTIPATTAVPPVIVPTRVESTPDFELLMKILTKVKLWHFGDGQCTLDAARNPTEVRIMNRKGICVGMLYKPEIAQALETVIGDRRA